MTDFQRELRLFRTVSRASRKFAIAKSRAHDAWAAEDYQTAKDALLQLALSGQGASILVRLLYWCHNFDHRSWSDSEREQLNIEMFKLFRLARRLDNRDAQVDIDAIHFADLHLNDNRLANRRMESAGALLFSQLRELLSRETPPSTVSADLAHKRFKRACKRMGDELIAYSVQK